MDNAKELILAKIKADLKYASLYALLESMGFEINDIVKFMTSPAILLISDLSTQSEFSRHNFKIYEIIEMLEEKDEPDNITKGRFKVLFNLKRGFLTKNLPLRIINKFGEEVGTELLKKISKANNESILAFNTIFAKIDEMDSDTFILLKRFEKVVNSIYKAKQNGFTSANLSFDLKGWNADLNEFKTLQLMQEEYSSLGYALGINLGIKGSLAELDIFVNNVRSIFSKRVLNIEKYDSVTLSGIGQEYKKAIENLGKNGVDIYKFVTDKEYQSLVINAYEQIKACVNPYRIIATLPQYSATYQLLAMVMDISGKFSIRSKIVRHVVDDLYAHGQYYISDNFYRLLVRGADNIIISKFFDIHDIKIPAISGSTVINADGTLKIVNSDYGLLIGASINGISSGMPALASFKCLMDTKYIKMMQDGLYAYLKSNGTVEIKTDQKLKGNAFLKALKIHTTKQGVDYYGIDFDMRGVDQSPSLREHYYEYQDAMNYLATIKINDNGVTLADMFFIYNLLVHKNRYGGYTLTRLFSDIANDTNNQNSIVYLYFKFIGELDKYGTVNAGTNEIYDITLNINDLLYAAASSNPVLERNEEYLKNYAIFVQLESGEFVLKTRDGNGKYQSQNSQMPIRANETLNEKKLRQYNIHLYFVLGGMNNYSILQNSQFIKKGSELTDEDINDLLREIYYFQRNFVIKGYKKVC